MRRQGQYQSPYCSILACLTDATLALGLIGLQPYAGPVAHHRQHAQQVFLDSVKHIDHIHIGILAQGVGIARGAFAEHGRPAAGRPR